MKCDYVWYVFFQRKFTFQFVQLHKNGDLITFIRFTCFGNAINKSGKEKNKSPKKRFTRQNTTFAQ